VQRDRLEFNPFDRSWWVDPYPFYGRLLDEAPSGKVAGLDLWYFAGYDECESILRDARFGVDERNSNLYRQFAPNDDGQRDELGRSFLFLDPPEHTRLRGFVSRSFTPRVVEGLRTRIATTVGELLDRLPNGTPFDLVGALAYPLPITVICDLLGIPASDRGSFHQWSRHLVASLDPELVVPPEVMRERRQAVEELRAYMLDLVAERARRPAGDLISALSEASTAAGPASESAMSQQELVTTLVLLLVAGYETTVNLVANAVLGLLRHPEAADLLSRRPALVVPCVEEVLRFDPPVQLTSRVALTDVEVGGIGVPAGAIAIVLVAAANRDPARVDRPEVFDITRAGTRHLSFSLGAHHCLGAPLARAEAQLALTGLVARHLELALAGEPRYRETLVLRGIEYLPVVARRR